MTNNLKNYINKNSLTILIPSLISLFAYINTEYKLYKQQLIESINEKENTLVTRFDNKDKYIFQNKIDQKYSDINIEIFNNIDKINSSRNYTQNIKIANNYLAKHKAYEYIIDNSSKKIYNSIENILINIIKINTLKLNNTNLDSIKFYTQSGYTNLVGSKS